MKISDLTDKQFKALQARLHKIGRDKLIDRLENRMINANLKGETNIARQCEVSIEWVRKQSGWITQ